MAVLIGAGRAGQASTTRVKSAEKWAIVVSCNWLGTTMGTSPCDDGRISSSGFWLCVSTPGLWFQKSGVRVPSATLPLAAMQCDALRCTSGRMSRLTLGGCYPAPRKVQSRMYRKDNHRNGGIEVRRSIAFHSHHVLSSRKLTMVLS